MNAQHSFDGSVQVSLSGLPGGVIAYPASPFEIAAGASIPVLFGVTPQAAAGNFQCQCARHERCAFTFRDAGADGASVGSGKSSTHGVHSN